MSRRSNPYFVALDNQQMFRIPAARWHQWVAVGMLILVAGRIAKPAAPGVVWLENGELHYPPDPIAPWINLNCRVMERHAIFDVRGPKLDPVVLQREIQRAYAD
jgi:hypothetical protein